MTNTMVPVLPEDARTGTTIPGAIARRKLLFAVVAIGVTALGVLGGLVMPEKYRAVATAAADIPGKDLLIPAAGDRFVNEQVGLFAIAEVQGRVAQRANDELAAMERIARGGVLLVGSGEAVRLGADGSATAVSPGTGLLVSADGSIAVADGTVQRVRSDGLVLTPAGSPAVDAAGRPVQVSPRGQVIVRWDGTIVVAEPGITPKVVSPFGSVITPSMPAIATAPGAASAGAVIARDAYAPLGSIANVAASQSGRLMITSVGHTVSLVPGARAALLDASNVEVRMSSTVDPVGRGARVILLSRGGDAIAIGTDALGARRITTVSSGAIVLTDEASRVLDATPGAFYRSVTDGAPTPVPFTSDLVGNVLTVTARTNTRLIEFSYADADGTRAMVAANAALHTYRELLRETALTARTSTLNTADDVVAQVSQNLEDVESKLAAVRYASPSRSALAATYDQLLAELIRTGSAATAGPLAPSTTVVPLGTTFTVLPGASVIDRLRAVIEQLNAIEAVENSDNDRPGVAEYIGERDRLRQRLLNLLAERDRVALAQPASGTVITYAAEAVSPEATRGLGPVRTGILSALLGLLLAAAIVYVLENRRPRISGTPDVDGILRVPLLAEVPDHAAERIDHPLPVVAAPASLSAESYRFAAAALGIVCDERGYRRIGIVSAAAGDGKTTVAANLVLALAQGHDRVLAIDADLEGQTLTHELVTAAGGADTWVGLADVLEAEARIGDAIVELTIADHRVNLLPGGSRVGRARAAFGGETARRAFDDVGRRFDITIVDLPALLNLAYAARVIRDLDAVVVVVPQRGLRRDLDELAQRLSFIGIPVIGYVLTRGPLRTDRTPSVPAELYGGASVRRADTIPVAHRDRDTASEGDVRESARDDGRDGATPTARGDRGRT